MAANNNSSHLQDRRVTSSLPPDFYPALFKTLPVASLVTDETGTVVTVSGGWQRLGQSRGSPIDCSYLNRPYLEVVEQVCGLEASLLAKLHKRVTTCLATGQAATTSLSITQPSSYLVPDTLTLSNGKSWFEFTVAPFGDPSYGVTLVCRDVSETRYAGYDPLTELSNRVLFEREANKLLTLAKRNRQQVALLYLDLDGFKGVNDRFGHAVGDALLKEVATRLTRLSRNSDLVSRHGGDEFVLLLYDSSPQQAVEAAERYRQGLAQPFTLATPGANTSLTLQSSWGVAHYPEAATLQDLIQRADSAMYQVKAEGGGVSDVPSLGQVQWPETG